jgi:RHS repeat-associated protein
MDNHLRQTNTTTGVSYFLTDHLGTTSALTDGSGTVVETQNYDSFGNNAGSARTRYTYTGRERDPDSGLLYYRARFYDPQLGRFISEDPIGLVGGINYYAYVSNNPAMLSDPLGLCPQDGKPVGPCAWEEERDMKWIGSLIGADFNWEGPAGNWNWNWKIPAGATEKSISQTLTNSGFKEFWNPLHFGTDLEKEINGRWYHITVNGRDMTEHWEISQPSSTSHKTNFWQNWVRPPEEECERRRLAGGGGGGRVEPTPTPTPKPKPTPRRGRGRRP